MRLDRALLCVEMDCQEVFAAAGACRCPACGNGVVLPLSRLLNPPAETCEASGPRLVTTVTSVSLTLEELATVNDSGPSHSGPSHCADETAEIADFRRFVEERLRRSLPVPELVEAV